MGKKTGFLEYERTENRAGEVFHRIGNFREFKAELSEDERREQGARCMNCGVPFCQSGMILSGMATGLFTGFASQFLLARMRASRAFDAFGEAAQSDAERRN